MRQRAPCFLGCGCNTGTTCLRPCVSKRLSTFDETDFNTFVESPPLSPASVEVKSQGGTRKTLSEDDMGKRVIVVNYGEGVLKFFGLNKQDGAARCGVARTFAATRACCSTRTTCLLLCRLLLAAKGARCWRG